ncbi:MAG: DNA polymerase III, partial [Pseudomonadota bacterium]
EQRPAFEVDIGAVISAAVRTGVALELNAYPDRLDLCDEHCRMAAEAGAWIAIGTDSHATTHLQMMHYGVSVARRGWLEARHVLNTYPASIVIQRASQRRRHHS